MARPVPLRPASLLLSLLALALWALLGVQLAAGAVSPVLAASALGATATVLAWHAAHGWRPFARRFVTCTVCGAKHRPDEAAYGYCPACAAHAVGA